VSYITAKEQNDRQFYEITFHHWTTEANRQNLPEAKYVRRENPGEIVLQS
jgi:hypothetical protein